MGGVNYMRLEELRAVWKDAGAEVTWEIWTQPLRQSYACTMVGRLNHGQAAGGP
jgi:hypothetical protein